MISSIRTYLLINLLLSVTLITSLAISGNLFLAHQDIQTQLDAQLIRTADRMYAFFSDGTEKRDLVKIQKFLLTPGFNTKRNNLANKEAQQKIQFQIWNQDDKLILHSQHTPNIPLSNGQTGLSTIWLNNQVWRVFTAHTPGKRLTLMISEQSNYRQQLEHQLTRDSILIMLITYPFLGFLIWIIVGKGLSPLKKITSAISKRKANYLEAVSLNAVPSEISPLIKEINQLLARLKEALNREKRFTADAAHELLTPLAALNTQAQVALKSPSKEISRQALNKVLTGVKRSTHVVKQLLILSRMVPEANANYSDPVNLTQETKETLAQLAHLAIEKNIELELHTLKNCTLIQGNAPSIGILIRNLVDNAIRYAPSHSIVKVSITQTQKKIRLTVSDNGPGIPEKQRRHVFERFYRILGNKTTGSGLGLSIVLQICKLHRSEIVLEEPENESGLIVHIDFEKKLDDINQLLLEDSDQA